MILSLPRLLAALIGALLGLVLVGLTNLYASERTDAVSQEAPMHVPSSPATPQDQPGGA